MNRYFSATKALIISIFYICITVECLAMKPSEFFHQLNSKNMHLVEEFYKADAVLVDPIGRIEGSSRIRAYYEHQYKNAQTIEWEIGTEFQSGNELSFPWVMILKAEGLNGGEAYRVDGMSRFVVEADGKVSFHQDYFDVGAFIYEKIPVMSHIVSYIKGRLKKGLNDFDALSK